MQERADRAVWGWFVSPPVTPRQVPRLQGCGHGKGRSVHQASGEGRLCSRSMVPVAY